jgi:hypothetical protein
MKKIKVQIRLIILWLAITVGGELIAQTIPLDTAHWNIQAQSYVLENYKGVPSIYLQSGTMTLKDMEFLNGTIEYDIFLKEDRGFPGIFFRDQVEEGNAEHFYIRPHQSGNPDANQAAPKLKGISPWQLYFGPRYSFAYNYHYDDWTHVKIKVNGDRAQVFLNHSDTPQLSWNLFHPAKKGKISLQGGNGTGVHIANVKVNQEAPKLIGFQAIERPAIDGLIQNWEISDKFAEESLKDVGTLQDLIKNRKWQGSIKVEEGVAANISRIQTLRNGEPGNTVFAKIEITSDQDQVRLFEFGYSDRVVAILNGKPIYRGTNMFRSRDYRYLGTVGLFDAVYLDLKKGKNTLVMAVSENFGGWLITGRFVDQRGVTVE